MIWLAMLWGCDAPPPEEELPFEPDLTCDPAAPDRGGAPLRRLTRAQYDHTVQDLFGVTGSFGALLDADEHVGPFASNGVTPVSQATVEQYQRAAEAVATAADLASLAPCNLLTEVPRDCAAEFVTTWLPRMYRRPATQGQMDRYLAIYDAFAEQGHVDALRVVTQAMLQSPHFLYHLEDGVPGGSESEALDGPSVASRLAFFLWNAAPDDRVLAAASTGQLDSVEGIRAEALRMLAHPKAARGIGQLHLEWLGVDQLPDVTKDPEQFPDHDAAAVAEMMDEVVRFADDVVRHGDGSLATLLTKASGSGSEPDRPGILALRAVQAAHAHYQRSSLTLRGKLVREELLCTPLPDPPPDVDLALPEVTEGTTREVVQAHLNEPACANCHALTDPIGFAFESWDAVGAYRALENGAPIDTTSELTASDVNGSYPDAAALTAALAVSDEVRWCVARQWFRYAHGRVEQPTDDCALSDAWVAMQRPANLRELVVAIVTSESFRTRRTP